ncbi:AraC family transcriptional regulator [Nocardia yamanashiensis]|uniref:AraC family transcriptional regulator n=1 Tax=Nocardia yamanashiensis TaxID=209247 RepID=UPI000832E2E5|nr:AraC family transcriptional regulator [Nocardia yamanashiensis]
MDVLSDAVAAMRIGIPHSNRTENHGPWLQRFPAADGAGFHVVLQGSCWLTPAHGPPLRLQVGDVAFLPREHGHAIGSRPDRDHTETPLAAAETTVLLCGAYRLDQARAHPLLTELPDIIHIPARVGRHPALRGAIDLLGYEIDSGEESGAIAPLLEVLLLYLLRAWFDAHPADSGWAAALHDPALRAVLRAMHGDPGRAWTVQSLAAQAGMSRSVFAQRFTATLRVAPQTYLTWWRMTLAARMLRETDALLRTIAEKHGYTSEYAFAKAFKREFGVSPGRYRSTARADTIADAG